MSKASLALLQHLQRALPRGELRLQPPQLSAYAGDKWFASHRPDAVALPRSTRSVSRILAFAHRHRIPVPLVLDHPK